MDVNTDRWRFETYFIKSTLSKSLLCQRDDLKTNRHCVCSSATHDSQHVYAADLLSTLYIDLSWPVTSVTVYVIPPKRILASYRLPYLC